MRNHRPREDQSWGPTFYICFALLVLGLVGLWVNTQPVELVSSGAEGRGLPKLKSMVCVKQAVVVVPDGAPSEVVGDTTVIYDADVVEVRCGRRIAEHRGEDVLIQPEGRR